MDALADTLVSVTAWYPTNGERHVPIGPVAPTEFLQIFLSCLPPGLLLGFLSLRDRPARSTYGRTDLELKYIIRHHIIVILLAVYAWTARSYQFAVASICFETTYEICDSFALLTRFRYLDQVTLVHHVFAPACMVMSCFTTVDLRVFCHLAISFCISAACLSYLKIVRRLSDRVELSAREAKLVLLVWVPFRVVGPTFCLFQILYDQQVSKYDRHFMQLYLTSIGMTQFLNLHLTSQMWTRSQLSKRVTLQ